MDEDILKEYSGVWEKLAEGHTQAELEIAALLRGIAAKIESPHLYSKADLIQELEYALTMARSKESEEEWWEQFCGGGDSTSYDLPSLIVVQ